MPAALPSARTVALRTVSLAVLVAALAGWLVARGSLTMDGPLIGLRVGETGYFYWRIQSQILLLLSALPVMAGLGWWMRESVHWPAVAEASLWLLVVSYFCVATLKPPVLTLIALLGMGVFLWLLFRTGMNAVALSDRLGRIDPGLALRCVPWVGAAILVVLANVVYLRQPFVVDSSAELFHARILRQGHFKFPAPPIFLPFRHENIISGPTGWYSQYPPGQIVWLAILDVFRASWLVNALFGVGILALTARIARCLYNDTVATCAVISLLISPFFLLMQSGMMSHGSSAFFLILAFWITLRIPDWKRQFPAALLLGIAVGISFATRSLTTIGFMIPLVLWGLYRQVPRLRRPWIAFGGATLGFMVPLGLYLFFNLMTTGSPLLTGYAVNFPKIAVLGFGDGFTPLVGLANSLYNLDSMNEYLLGVGFGSFSFIAVHLLAGRWERADALVLACIASLSALYMLFRYQDFGYGPRFLYEVLPLFCILTGRGFVVLTEWIASASPAQDRQRVAVGVALIMGLFVVVQSVGYSVNLLTRTRAHAVFRQRTVVAPIQPYVYSKRTIVFVGGAMAAAAAPYTANWPDGPLFLLDYDAESNRRAAEAFPGWRLLMLDQRTNEVVPFETLPSSSEIEGTAQVDPLAKYR